MSKPIIASVAATIANTTLVTTTPAAPAVRPQVTKAADTGRLLLIGWAQITTGAGTTGIRMNIRRRAPGVVITVGEVNTITLGAAAGSTEQFTICAIDSAPGSGTVEYDILLQQVDATGNGTILQILLLGIAL